MAKEINYTLEVPVEYASKGELVQGAFVTLLPPTSRQMTECAGLKQAFFRALPKTGAMEVEPAEADGAEVTGDALMTMIAMSPDVELAKVILLGRELLASGVALMDGETKMTKPLLDSLTQDDLEGLIGEYMAAFIVASALRKAKKSSSTKS